MPIKKKCLYIIIPLLSLVSFKTGASGPAESNCSISRQIQYSFTLQNKTNHLLKKAEFWSYAPVKQTSMQRCERLDASHPFDLIMDDLGNQILYFKFDNLPPYSTKIVTISAGLVFFDTPNPSSLCDSQIYLKSEKYIESDDPELSQFARKFKASESAKPAEKIFHWVAENIQYTGYIQHDRGALYALKKRQGDCTEFMYLFIALCRANNIPSRGIGGYICGENSILRPDAYHNWAEFYDGDVWRIADPQKNIFIQNPSYYIAMRIVGTSPKSPMGEFHRFRFAGDGLKVKMNQ